MPGLGQFRGLSATWLGVCALALLGTLLNAFKPLVVDDAAYFYFAEQMAKDALDPYGFEVFWYESPEPANHVLAPPVLPYWWSLALRQFGMRPFLWKLWLFPFQVLLVGALFALARRFARGLEWPLVIGTVLSPAILPSSNLMLDVPALALSLGAVVLFLRAGERGSLWLAVASGLVAGLAMQTKYTSFVTPAVFLAAAWLGRRLSLGLVAVATAVLIFASWEAVIAARYGESHFLHAVRDSQVQVGEQLTEFLAEHPTDSALLRRCWSLFFSVAHKSYLVWPLLTVFGAVAPALILFHLAALGISRRWFVRVACLIGLGFVLVAAVPEHQQALFGEAGGGAWWTRLDALLFGTAGVVLYVLTAQTARRLRRRRRGRLVVVSRRFLGGKRKAQFLTLWLVLEVLAYFALTPFSAVRRLLSVLVVTTLLASQLAARTCRTSERRVLVYVATALSVGLGLLFQGLDLIGAAAHQTAAERAAQFVRERTPEATAWFVGHWGFQFYAEREGLRPVVPRQSLLRQGDWLVVPDPQHINQQRIALDPERTELVEELLVMDGVPLRTVPGYYGGLIPLEHQSGPRVQVRLYRVTRDHVPAWKVQSP